MGTLHLLAVQEKKWMLETLTGFSYEVLVHIVASLIVIALLAFIGYLTFSNIRRVMGGIGFLRRMLSNDIVNFYCSRDEYRIARREKNIEEYMLRAQREFTYVGFYLSSGTDTARLEKGFRTLLERNCTITLVLLHQDLEESLLSAVEQHLAIATGTLRKRLQHAYETFAGFAASLSADQRERFIVLKHKTPITSSAMFVDFDESNGLMLVDSKIFGIGRDRSYGMEFRKPLNTSSLALNFANSFQQIMDSAKPF
jgi:hypothetical protein